MKLYYLANVRLPSERAHAIQIAHMSQALSTFFDVTLIVNKRANSTEQELNDWLGVTRTFHLRRISQIVFVPNSKSAFILSELFFTLNFLISTNIKNDEIIYCRSEWSIFILSFFLSKKRLIWESHEAKYNFAARWIIRKEIKIVAISEGIKSFYVMKDAIPEKVLVAHDAVDESFFGSLVTKSVARKELKLPEDEKVAMYIGGFDSWKGIETFLKASSLCDDVTFVAIGGHVDQIKFFKEQYPSVIFLGQRPYKDLKNNQQAADVLVIPNTSKNLLSAEYTSPLKLFAHMASGIPVVASNIMSIRNVISENEAYLFEADNPKALSEAISNAMENVEESYLKAKKAFDLSKKYTWKFRSEKIFNFVSEDV